MIFLKLKTTTLTALIAGTLITGASIHQPAQAHSDVCISQIQSIDRSIKKIKLGTKMQERITSLRDSAITRVYRGDRAGCMQNVALIKRLLDI